MKVSLLNFEKYEEYFEYWILHENAADTHSSKGSIPDSGGHIHKVLSPQHNVFQFACDGTALHILTVLQGHKKVEATACIKNTF